MKFLLIQFHMMSYIVTSLATIEISTNEPIEVLVGDIFQLHCHYKGIQVLNSLQVKWIHKFNDVSTILASYDGPKKKKYLLDKRVNIVSSDKHTLKEFSIMIEDSKLSDDGSYFCKLDYMDEVIKSDGASTMVSILVPPSKLKMSAHPVAIWEGKLTNIACVVERVKPVNGILIDIINGSTPLPKSEEVMDQLNEDGITFNVKRAYDINFSRYDHQEKLTCVVVWKKQTLKEDFTLSVKFKPFGPLTDKGNPPVAEGGLLVLNCISPPSNPPAAIIWTGEDLAYNKTEVHLEGHYPGTKTSSTIIIKAERDLNYELVSCAIYFEDKAMPNMTKFYRLNIMYPPDVDIPQSNMTVDQAHGDIVIDCIVEEGNPIGFDLQWWHETENKRLLSTNKSKLVINNVKHDDIGWYVCEAKTIAGANSDRIFIDALYSPLQLSPLLPKTVLSTDGDPVSVNVSVSANPIPSKFSLIRKDGETNVWGEITINMSIRELSLHKYVVQLYGLPIDRDYKVIIENGFEERLEIEFKVVDDSQYQLSNTNATNNLRPMYEGNNAALYISCGVIFLILILILLTVMCYRQKKRSTLEKSRSSSIELTEQGEKIDKPETTNPNYIEISPSDYDDVTSPHEIYHYIDVDDIVAEATARHSKSRTTSGNLKASSSRGPSKVTERQSYKAKTLPRIATESSSDYKSSSSSGNSKASDDTSPKKMDFVVRRDDRDKYLVLDSRIYHVPTVYDKLRRSQEIQSRGHEGKGTLTDLRGKVKYNSV